MKTLRAILDSEFKVILLDDNPTWLVRVGVDLSARVKKYLVEFLRANTDLFAISPHKILGIDSSMACHLLNINPCV